MTIVGNPVDNDNTGNQYSGTNVQANTPPPPAQQEFAPVNDNVEPTLENGFHMRFQIESPGSVERLSGIGNSSSSPSTGSYYAAGSGGGSGAKARKRVISMSERSFNFKKKLKNWMPKRKKKYHPTLCEKFR